MTTAGEAIQQHANNEREFEIFVGDLREAWDVAAVLARDIILRAGYTEPDKFVLEALDHRGGTPVAEFNPGVSVDLNDKDRKFFRVTPGGGGRS
jgi:hypothetical protein